MAMIAAPLEQISKTINLRQFESAYKRALKHTVRHDPENAEAWFQVALSANLTDRPDEAHMAYYLAKQYTNFTTMLDGHFHRDFMLRAIRLRLWPLIEAHYAKIFKLHIEPFLELLGVDSTNKDLLSIGGEVIEIEASMSHHEYANAFAVTLGTLGRWHEAKKEFVTANQYHELADSFWLKLGRQANAQWRYNNIPHWLLTVVQISSEGWGKTLPDVQQEIIENLYGLLETTCPEGAKPRLSEANIMLLPKVGPQLYHALAKLRHKVRRFGL